MEKIHKSPKSFRLSKQAVAYLRLLVEKTGTNETAIVEIALATLYSQMDAKQRVGKLFGNMSEQQANYDK
jgi:cobalamin-dependent methionine synthase I